MLPTAPPATGVRTPWERLPAHVRGELEAALGAPVAEAVTQRGGFSPGAAARVRLRDGRRAFVKAVSAEANPGSPKLHRAEARHSAVLPDHVPAPRLLASYDDGVWVALAFEEIEGRQPHVPWCADELVLVLDAVTELSYALTPSPVEALSVVDTERESFRGWERLIEADTEDGADQRLDPWVRRNLRALAELAAPWTEAATGDTLIHADLRADNMLITPEGRVVFVDWPHAVRAAPWTDLLFMLPCVRAQGGPDPEGLFAAHPLGRDADPRGVTATLAAFAGYLVRGSLKPDPPGLPTLRAFQAAQGAAAVGWLRTRLGPGLP
ncbi:MULTISPECIES: phosphotransferase [Streptomyces]|uniref:Aminoglycoside phosphotransferase n=1 Tax=Streptomyces venezuelae TaxID=54571 RepID=A0A5P2B7E3_STRVZ|nr:phosphotransferase [Streptomyces venezuelae]MYY86363.1 phosphotransferase [Streptomyces sp. SID335]MYZ14043.1 phosphotransferase [Streptomyces sp. SID337]NDZ86696.1 phosphotransferase [Streptomyces sp. SID10115]NEB47006.1 phosphotransferase [Streptomyces sp. SID339]QES26176.1 aminoglycoside phosphotransferase [Streptomyces venezuelae]